MVLVRNASYSGRLAPPGMPATMVIPCRSSSLMSSSAPVAFILSSFFGLAAGEGAGARKTKPPPASRQQGFRNVRFSPPSGRDGLGHDHYDHAHGERAWHRIERVADGVHRVGTIARNARPV